ncbi:MAG: hypothetical protein ACOC5T_04860 [Elusimicrobiota bacterium]
MGLFRKKNSGLTDAERQWIIKSQNPRKTYIIAVIHKKNKKLYETVVELEGEIITIQGTPHYAGNDSIFFKRIKVKKNKYDVPKIDVYEGMALAVHPSQTTADPMFSKRVVDMIGLHIEQGVLESRRKKKLDLKKIIMAVLIGIAAIFIFTKMF